MRGRVAKPFESYLRRNGDCVEWTGCVSSSGYGNLRRERKNYTAHEFSWIQKFGSVPEGKELAHKCDNKICVNTDHLFLATHLENVRDAVGKKRHAKGSTHGNSKLTIADVDRIKEAYSFGATQRDLALVWGVRQSQISRIVTGVRWGG